MSIDEQLRRAGAQVHAAMAAEPIPNVPTYRHSRRRATLAAVAVAALVGAVLLVPRADQGRTELSTASSSAPQTEGVALGTDYLWPPSSGYSDESEVALAFAREVLGWTTPGATVSGDADPSAFTWVRLVQPGNDEIVDVLTVLNSDGTWVIVEVGVPWATGVLAEKLPEGEAGSKIGLIRVAGAVESQISVRLRNGASETFTATEIDIQAGRLDAPQLTDPSTIESILVLYLDGAGRVIAATGASEGAER